MYYVHVNVYVRKLILVLGKYLDVEMSVVFVY